MNLEHHPTHNEDTTYPKEKLGEIALQISEIEKTLNRGRGVACVRGIIDFLNRGDFKSAKQLATHDHDKIRNYKYTDPQTQKEVPLDELLESFGLCESDKTFSERWSKNTKSAQ